MKICDFTHRDVRKLAVGLVLGLFLVVAAMEQAEGRLICSAPKQAEMSISEVCAFVCPPHKFRKEAFFYRKLASYMQKMCSNSAAGDHQGHKDLGSWL